MKFLRLQIVFAQNAIAKVVSSKHKFTLVDAEKAVVSNLHRLLKKQKKKHRIFLA